MIRGTTSIIAHIGYPTSTFKAPMVFNPYFEKYGIDAVVVPFGVKAEDYADVFRATFRMTNVQGALITMPHKVTTIELLDEVSTTVKVAGSCNGVVRRPDGSLFGDLFDGEGFVRGIKRKGRQLKGARALVIGNGGVGSAIAASLALAGVAELGLFDPNSASSEALSERLRQHYPELDVVIGNNDPAGYDLVVNASPLGMVQNDPLPVDVSRIAPTAFVGEVVMKEEITPFLRAALERGCQIQVGTDMLFEQVPAYLEFFGYPSTTTDELRAIARIQY